MTTKLHIATSLKVGDTFSCTLTARREGSGVDLTNVTVTSTVKSLDGSFEADLVVSAVDLLNGQVKLRSDTATWPVGVLKWDVQFVEVGDTWSTPTRGVNMTEDNT